VLLAFGAAMILVPLATTQVVGAVAAARAGRGAPLARIQDEAMAFAFSPSGIMLAATLSAATLLCISFVATRLGGGRFVARLRLGPSRASAAGIAAAVAGMIGLSLAAGTASQVAGDVLHLTHPGVMEQIERAIGALPPERLTLAVLTIAIGPGVAEETFFRGLFQPPLVARWGRWPGIATSALAFGLLHMDVVQGSAAFACGLFLGWLADRLGGTRPSMAAHVTNNALAVAIAALGADRSPSRAQELITAGAGLAVLAVSIAVLRSRVALRGPATT
jgi:membrane protease YdiL (CAAX protease family)